MRSRMSIRKTKKRKAKRKKKNATKEEKKKRKKEKKKRKEKKKKRSRRNLFNMTREELILDCRYYNGEKEPPEGIDNTLCGDTRKLG